MGDLYKLAQPRVLEIIGATYRNQEGREPVGFEIVANLAAVKGASSAADISQLVRDQIEYLKAWEKLKSEWKKK